MNYIDYYIRVLPANYDKLLQLGETLGILKVYEDLETNQKIVSVTDGSWDYIGEIYRPTGEFTQDDEGNQIAVQDSIKDSETGIPYIHINLRTTIDILSLAQEKALDNTDIQEALNSIGSFFVTEHGTNKPKIPNRPARVFF